MGAAASSSNKRDAAEQRLPPTGPSAAAEIFLCHTGKNKEFVHDVNRRLRCQEGWNTFLDASNIHVGDALSETIYKAIHNSNVALVFLSDSFFEKKWPQAELQEILKRRDDQESGSMMIIIPIVIDLADEALKAKAPVQITKIKYARVDSDDPFRVEKVVEFVKKRLQRNNNNNSSASCRDDHAIPGANVVAGLEDISRQDPDGIGRFEGRRHKEMRQKVIDAYYAISFPSVELPDLHAPSRNLAVLKAIVDDIKEYDGEHDASDNDLPMQNNYLVHVSDGRGDKVRKELVSSHIRLFIWCAEGVNECCVDESAKELSAVDFSSGNTPDAILVCMKFGAQYIAKKLHERTLKTVFAISFDPFRDLSKLCAVVFLPFVASVGNDFETSFKLLQDKAKSFYQACKCYAYPARELDATALAPYHHRSLINNKKMHAVLTIGSLSTTQWFSIKALRLLKMNPGDAAMLQQVVAYFTEHEHLDEPLCLFLMPDSALGKREVQESKACERARAVVLYACDRITRDGIFHHGLFRVASKSDKIRIKTKLKGKTMNALVWLDFMEGEIPFLCANELEEWVSSLDVLPLLVITSTRARCGLLGQMMKNVQHSKLLKVERFQIAKHAQPEMTSKHLRGFLRILPLKNADEKVSKCVLDSVIYPEQIKDEVCHAFTANSCSDGFRNDAILQDIVIYRDDDSSVLIGVCVKDIKFLIWLRDTILLGENRGMDLLFGHSGDVVFDRTAMADVYEEMVLQLDNMTKYQRRKLTWCIDQKRVSIQGPAGCGKTFLALNRVLTYLTGDPDAKVLYVCRNAALAFHFIKWLCHRLHQEGTVMLKLEQIFFLSCEKPTSVCGIHYSKARSVLQEEADLDSRTFAGAFHLVVIDQAHDIFCRQLSGDPAKLRETTCSILRSNKNSEVMVLSDASQASAPQPGIDEEFFRQMQPAWRSLMRQKWRLYPVKLDEVCRSSQRIIVGSMCFQVGDERPATSCAHESAGLPLPTILFNGPGDNGDLYGEYSNRIVQCIRKLLDTFPGLDLHDRIAVIVPDKEFRYALCSGANPLLGSALQKAKDLLGQFLVPVTAEKASRSLGLERDARPSSEKWLVVDSVDEMDGLERLVVIGVGLDKKIDDDSRLTCTRIYRAMTRAQLIFYLINKRIQGGWFEFLDNIVLSREGRSGSPKVERLSTHAARRIVNCPAEGAANKEYSPSDSIQAWNSRVRANTIFDTQKSDPNYSRYIQRQPKFVPVGGEAELWHKWAEKHSGLYHEDENGANFGPQFKDQVRSSLRPRHGRRIRAKQSGPDFDFSAYVKS